MSMIIGQLVCLLIFAFYIYTYVEFKEGCENNDEIITSEDLEESLILKKGELQELNSQIKNDIEVKEVK